MNIRSASAGLGSSGIWRQASILGALRAVQLVQPDGTFIYSHGPDGMPLKGYSVLRHAAAVWAMLRVADDVARPAAQRAMGWLSRHYLQTDDGQALALVYRGEAKAGASALAILAHVALGSDEDLRLARGLAAGLLVPPPADGRNHHEPSAADSLPEGRGAHLPAQIMLALATLAEATGELRFLNEALRFEARLAPTALGTEERSHWMMQALEVLHRTLRMAGPAEVTREDIERHAAAITMAILDDLYPSSAIDPLKLACRSQALLAA